MPTATLTSKGQMVIPKPIREYLDIHPGDRLDFVIRDNHRVEIQPAASDIRELKGILYRRGRKAVSLAAMEKAIRMRAGR
jgi:antitoxin PrlF